MNTNRILVLMIAAATTGLFGVAHASDLRMTVEKPHFTCEGRGALLSHAAYHPGEAGAAPMGDDAPLPCCDGQIGCAQFLSTNTVIHPARALRG